MPKVKKVRDEAYYKRRAEKKEHKKKLLLQQQQDPSTIYNTPEWWCKWFQRPENLHVLMYMPNDAQLLDWVRAIAVHQDSLAPDSLQRQAWFLGATYRKLLDQVIELKWNVYCVFVILVFVFCIPEARSRLPKHDHDFLNSEVVPRYQCWIRGLRPDGSLITHSSQAVHNLIPVLVHQLMDMYATGYLIPPLAHVPQSDSHP